MDRSPGNSLLPTVPASLAGFDGAASVALVLGSGLSGLADRFDERTDVAYADIEGFPPAPTEVAGHGGQLSLAHSGGVRALLFQGRLHCYQGVSALDASYPARLATALGCKTLVVTNAAGGLDTSFAPGDLMVITDHINMIGDNPLVGWPGPPGGVPFVPMGDAYDPALVTLAFEVAGSLGMTLRQGVYAAVMGPCYETPAEVEALSRAGASAVGMSTVPEVIAARALGLRVMGLSLVTNVAGGAHLSHDEVLAAGEAASASLTELVLAILGRLQA